MTFTEKFLYNQTHLKISLLNLMSDFVEKQGLILLCPFSLWFLQFTLYSTS